MKTSKFLIAVTVGLMAICGAIVALTSQAEAVGPNDCTVSTTIDNTGPNSLRGCLLALQPGAAIFFASSVFSPTNPATIFVGSPLPTIITSNVSLDASGAGVQINGFFQLSGDGLVISSTDSVTIAGLQIVNFRNAGLRLQGATNAVISGNLVSGNLGSAVYLTGGGTSSNTIVHNLIGTNISGTNKLPNNRGIMIDGGASLNYVIDNLVSGNSNDGIVIKDSGTSGNVVHGNYIGSTRDGEMLLDNLVGVRLDGGTQRNLITGNLISGNNDKGVIIRGSGTMSNSLINNQIGTNPAGTKQVLNVEGIVIEPQARANIIDNNLISGNPLRAFTVLGDDNIISRNIIGPNRQGTGVIGNGFALHLQSGARGNLITGNLISGNSVPGIIIEGSGAVSNTIANNIIGADISGLLPLANNSFGVLLINGAQFNQFYDNIVAFNARSGVAIYGTQSFGNTLRRNRIFKNADKGIALLNNGNRNLSPPALTNIGFTSVSGRAGPNQIIDIFSDDELQGRYFHGTIIADAGGHFTFTQSGVFTGPNLSATATDAEGNTSGFSGNGTGFFFSAQQLAGSATSSTTHRALAAGDIKRDGYVDAVVIDGSQLKVWFNDGSGNFALDDSYPITGAQVVALGDMDNSGFVDAVVGTSGGVEIWLNNGAGQFTDTWTLASNAGQAVAVDNLNSDQHLDLVVASPAAQDNQIWLSNGAGVFTNSGTLGRSSGQALVVADFDKDDQPDVLLGNGNGLATQVWLNNGGGTFNSGDVLDQAIDSLSLASSDLDNDGHADIIAGSSAVSQIWLNDGAGTFTLGQTLSGTFASQAIALGDLNSDGTPDAVIANGSGPPTQVWLNNGSGSFNPGQEIGNTNQAIDLGDFDNDNDPDIFVINDSSLLFDVLFNADRVIARLTSVGGGLTAISQSDLTTTITVPAGVLTRNTILTYRPTFSPTEPVTSTLRFADRSFSLVATQEGAEVSDPFSGSITIRLDYAAPVSRPGNFFLYLWDIVQTAWRDAACDPASSYNQQASFISVAVCHLTEFGLFEDTGRGLDVYLPLVIKAQ